MRYTLSSQELYEAPLHFKMFKSSAQSQPKKSGLSATLTQFNYFKKTNSNKPYIVSNLDLF